jgi:hypothetical protein
MFTEPVTSPIGLTVRYGRLDDLRESLPADESEWLTPAERREVTRYRAPSRRDGWLCGRALAKQVITCSCLGPPVGNALRGVLHGRCASGWHALRDEGRGERRGTPATPMLGVPPERGEFHPTEIEILSRDAQGNGVSPCVRIAGEAMPWHLSISHSDRGVLVALSVDPTLRVGVDLASPDQTIPAAIGFWFTEGEREAGCLSDARQAATGWAIKEAAYKALNTGEPFVPHRYEVVRRGDEYRVRCADADELISVEVRDVDGHIAAHVAVPGNHSTPGRGRAPATSV